MRTFHYVLTGITATISVTLACAAVSVAYADDVYETPDGTEKLKARGVLVLEISPDGRGVTYASLEKTQRNVPGEVISGCFGKCRVRYAAPAVRSRLIERWLAMFPKAELTTISGERIALFGFGLKQCVQPGFFSTSSLPDLRSSDLPLANRQADPVPFSSIARLTVAGDEVIVTLRKNASGEVRARPPRWSQYPSIKPCFSGFTGSETAPGQDWTRFDIAVDQTRNVVFK